MSHPEKTLDQLRVEIDAVDHRLVRQINQRCELAVEWLRVNRNGTHRGSNRGPAGNRQTESESLERIISKNAGPIPNSALQGVYREILNGAFVLDRPTRVGYLGPQGTFSHLAASQYFGESVEYENLRTLEGVFEEVARGHVEYGLVPIENSIGGAIIETLDAFTNHEGRLTICGEVQLAITFGLLGKCSANQVKVVYSKGEALAQCHPWLTEHFPEAQRIPVQSTATAAELAFLADPADGVVAIGSSMAGKLYGLDTLFDRIESSSNNVTRFLILSRKESAATGHDKTSIMFTCTDRPGALVDILSVFRRYDINLSHIEKRPRLDGRSGYTFFMDMLGNVNDGKTAEVLGEVRASCKILNVLGSFPIYDEAFRYVPAITTNQFDSLESLNQAIDQADSDLIQLINERALLVVDVGEFKRKSAVPIYAPHREAAVLAKIASLNQGPLPNRTMESIYRELMSGSFALEKPLRIGFPGLNGEFSHLASIRHFGSSVEFVAAREIRSVFQQVVDGEIDYGLVPIENCTVGGIGETLDAFIDFHEQLRIYGEVQLEVRFCLLANCRPEQVKKIYSKPEVFLLCRNWLSTQYPNAIRIPAESMAMATQMAQATIETDSEGGVAAIGSSLAGEIYGLKPLFEAIEDKQNNKTRFLILSKSKTERSGNDKTSIMFTTQDRSGALVDVLEVFKRHSINLTHIEKRPSREENWDYTFFLDFDGHREDSAIAQIIGEARAHCKNLTVLGSFPVSKRVL